MTHQIKEAADYILNRGATAQEVGVILGTGLGNLIVDKIRNPILIPYEDIPHFPTSTVEFHKGKLIYGDLA